MNIMRRTLIQDGDIKVWEIKGNTGDYLKVYIPVDTDMSRVAHVNVFPSGSFNINRLIGEVPEVPHTGRMSPYCTFENKLPFSVLPKGELIFTAAEDNSIWYCLSHSQFNLLTGESFKVNAGETISISSNNYVFVANGTISMSGVEVTAPNLFLKNVDDSITAVTDCFIVRIDKNA